MDEVKESGSSPIHKWLLWAITPVCAEYKVPNIREVFLVGSYIRNALTGVAERKGMHLSE